MRWIAVVVTQSVVALAGKRVLIADVPRTVDLWKRLVVGCGMGVIWRVGGSERELAIVDVIACENDRSRLFVHNLDRDRERAVAGNDGVREEDVSGGRDILAEALFAARVQDELDG
jgi:hypothetical protein